MKEDAISTMEAMMQGIEKARSKSGQDGEKSGCGGQVELGAGTRTWFRQPKQERLTGFMYLMQLLSSLGNFIISIN